MMFPLSPWCGAGPGAEDVHGDHSAVACWHGTLMRLLERAKRMIKKPRLSKNWCFLDLGDFPFTPRLLGPERPPVSLVRGTKFQVTLPTPFYLLPGRGRTG